MKEKIKTQKGFSQILILITIIISVVVASGISYGVVEYNKISKLINEAEKLSKEEQYDEAINKLESAKSCWVNNVLGIKKQEIINEIDNNKKLLESKSEYTQGVEEFNKGNWEKAKELLSKISEISPYYQDAKSKVEEAQNKIMNEKINEAVNKAKIEIQNQQTKQPIENSPLLQNNSTEQSNEITSADLQRILPYINEIVCSAQDAYGDYISSEGSASLWVLKGKMSFILTNYHVIKPIIENYNGWCHVLINAASYDLDIQNIPSSIFNNFLDFAFLKITSATPVLNGTPFPSPDTLSSEELLSIPPCPIKMPLGSSVAVIGYPITARSQIDFTNQFGERESAPVSNEAVTTGIISSYNINPISNGYSDVNYFVSAKIDKGNSGGLAFSKNNGQLCILGVPTWVEQGYFENMGIIQSFHNIWNF
jgi:tetratricopeptide (TPR) repeat protein